MRCGYAHDDAAYVLGALSPAERDAYERHLQSCPSCQQSVADLAGMPGLMARLDPAVANEVASVGATALDLPSRPVLSPAVLPRLLATAASERRRGWRRSALVAAAAAVLALLLGVGGGVLAADLNRNSGGGTPTAIGSTPASESHAMQPVRTGLPVSADVRLIDEAWGTDIQMHCRYADLPDYRPHRRWEYQLFAVSADGVTEQLSSWLVAPGENLLIRTTTRFHSEELARLELRKPDGSVLLRYVT